MTWGACSLKVIMSQFVVLRSNMHSPHTAQETLPRRRSSHSFTEYKKERAGVVATAARLPETNSVKLLTQGLETFNDTLFANCKITLVY